MNPETPEKPTPRRRVTDFVRPAVPAAESKPEISDTSVNIARDIRRWLRVLIAMTSLLYVLTATWAFYTFHAAERNRKALCTLRANTQIQIEQTQQFLIDHPRGFPGVSNSDLKANIRQLQKTVDALDTLHC